MKNLRTYVFAGLAFLGTSCASYNHLSESTINKLGTLEHFQGQLGKKYITYESDGKFHRLNILDEDSTNVTYTDLNGDFETDRIEISYPQGKHSIKTAPSQKEFNKTLCEILKSRKN